MKNLFPSIEIPAGVNYGELEEKFLASLPAELKHNVKLLNLGFVYSIPREKLLKKLSEEELAAAEKALEMFKNITLPAPPSHVLDSWFGLKDNEKVSPSALINFSSKHLGVFAMKNYCVACGSTAVKILKKLISKRPNGDAMEQMKCKECKCVWEE